MNKNKIRSIEDAFIYITDCNLATVEDLALKKGDQKLNFKNKF